MRVGELMRILDMYPRNMEVSILHSSGKVTSVELVDIAPSDVNEKDGDQQLVCLLSTTTKEDYL